MYDVIILGSGPAGWTAAIYCGRAKKSTLVLSGESLGGQTGEIAELENYPGWNGSGMGLINFMKKQAESFGAKVEFASAKNIQFNDDGTYTVVCDNKKTFDAKITSYFMFQSFGLYRIFWFLFYINTFYVAHIYIYLSILNEISAKKHP